MPNLLNESYSKKYTAPILSCATFISLVLLVLSIILPYFLADFSGGFWRDTSIYYEQPNVSYKDQMILYLLEEETASIRTMKYFSSMLQLNNYYVGNLLNIPMVKYEDFDINFDKLIDQFVFKINFYSTPDFIKNIKLLFLFDYSIKTRVNGTMQTLAVVDIDTPYGASYVRVEGDLRINQKSPIDANTFISGNYHKDVFESREPIEYDELLDIFNNRLVSTVFDYEKVVIPMRHDQITQLEIIVNIPSFEEYTVVVPSFTQVKFAWIQYLAMFLPIAFVCYVIMIYIFTNRIFQCTTVSDLPKLR